MILKKDDKTKVVQDNAPRAFIDALLAKGWKIQTKSEKTSEDVAKEAEAIADSIEVKKEAVKKAPAKKRAPRKKVVKKVEDDPKTGSVND